MNWTTIAPAGGRAALLARFDLDAPGAADPSLLSREEIGRAGRFRSDRDARRSLAARTFLRRALGERLGVEPARLVFGRGAHGRPELLCPGAPHAFSLAHSEGEAVLALVEEGRVGVDLERRGAAPDAEDLAPLALAAEELEEFRSLPAGRRETWFLERWTAREAVLKAAGSGLCCDPASIALEPREGGLDASGDPRVAGLRAWPLDAGEAFVGFLATDADSR